MHGSSPNRSAAETSYILGLAYECDGKSTDAQRHFAAAVLTLRAVRATLAGDEATELDTVIAEIEVRAA